MRNERKALTDVRVKAGDSGEVTAVFSTFNVGDHDGDVTLPGAFQAGAPVRISAYNHGSSIGPILPVGKGKIRVTEEAAIMEGKFFMDTAHGRDTFLTIKEMGELQEWSYAYDILDSEMGTFDGDDVQFLKKLTVNEVSPVLLGAGIGTRTLSAKGVSLTLSDHIEAVMAEVKALTERIEEVKALRVEKGKDLGEQSRALVTELERNCKRLRDVLAIEPQEEPDDQREGRRLYLDSIRRGLIEPGGSNG